MRAPAFVLASAEKLLEQAVRLDPQSGHCLAALADKVVCVQLTQPDLWLYILPHARGASLLGHYEGEADATVRAAPFTLLRMLKDPDSRLLSEGEVVIEGETGTAQRLMDCFKALDIDWEEQLARLVGDIPAHWLGTAVRRAVAWGQTQHTTLEHNLSEYVQEEARLLPPAAEVQAFMDDVDSLRDDLERLVQRIARLERPAD